MTKVKTKSKTYKKSEGEEIVEVNGYRYKKITSPYIKNEYVYIPAPGKKDPNADIGPDGFVNETMFQQLKDPNYLANLKKYADDDDIRKSFFKDQAKAKEFITNNSNNKKNMAKSKRLTPEQLKELAKRIDAFETKKGGSQGNPLSIDDYSKGKASNIDELADLIGKEYLPKIEEELKERGLDINDLNEDVVYELADYGFNSGRSAADLLTYAMDKSSIDELKGNTPKVDLSKAGSLSIDKIYKAKDDAYKTTYDKANKKSYTLENPNPAYEKSWKFRIGSTQDNHNESGDFSNDWSYYSKQTANNDPVSNTSDTSGSNRYDIDGELNSMISDRDNQYRSDSATYQNEVKARDDLKTDVTKRKQDAYYSSKIGSDAYKFIESMRQIREGKNKSRELAGQRPQMPTVRTSEDLAYATQQAQARAGKGLTDRALGAIATQDNLDYANAIQGIETASAGQAGSYGALTSKLGVDALKRNLLLGQQEQIAQAQNEQLAAGLSQARANELSTTQQLALRYGYQPRLDEWKGSSAEARETERAGRLNLARQMTAMPNTLSNMTSDYYRRNEQLSSNLTNPGGLTDRQQYLADANTAKAQQNAIANQRIQDVQTKVNQAKAGSYNSLSPFDSEELDIDDVYKTNPYEMNMGMSNPEPTPSYELDYSERYAPTLINGYKKPYDLKGHDRYKMTTGGKRY